MVELSISLDPAGGGSDEQLFEYFEWVRGLAGADLPDVLNVSKSGRILYGANKNISIHLDVMDGDFVPRSSVTMEQYGHIVKNTGKQIIDVHLMVSNPEKVINQYLAKAVWGGIRSISFHVEAVSPEVGVVVLQKIKSLGIEGGIVVDLDTEISSVSREMLDLADVVTVMTVKCGMSGQSFNEGVLEKVRKIRETYQSKSAVVSGVGRVVSRKRIIVDGGVNLSNAESVVAAGADCVVVGGGVYFAGKTKKDRKAAVVALRAVL